MISQTSNPAASQFSNSYDRLENPAANNLNNTNDVKTQTD